MSARQPSFTEKDRQAWNAAIEAYQASEITEAEYRQVQRAALEACNRSYVTECMAQQS